MRETPSVAQKKRVTGHQRVFACVNSNFVVRAQERALNILQFLLSAC